jgi:menaquinone reductase, multiheme cytochrome c subunit
MSNEKTPSDKFVFPRWANYLLPVIVIAAAGGGAVTPAIVGLGFSANTLNVGYAPEQPVPYSHALHVGELGMDCRYCHTTVEDASFAAIPPTQTCMNCHDAIRSDSPRLEAVFKSNETGEPVPWTKVNDLPDYVYFNHSAHVNKGVSCVSCHGRVDKMTVVQQAKPLSMGWCLDCHREPEKHLRPLDKVTDLAWKPVPEPGETPEDAQLRVGLHQKQKLLINDEAFMTSCSTCHR